MKEATIENHRSPAVVKMKNERKISQGTYEAETRVDPNGSNMKKSDQISSFFKKSGPEITFVDHL